MKVLVSGWDAVELWLVHLPFIPQVLMLLAMMLPLAAGLAMLLDGAISYAQRRISRDGA